MDTRIILQKMDDSTKICLNQLRNRKGYLIRSHFRSHFWKSELWEGSCYFCLFNRMFLANLSSYQMLWFQNDPIEVWISNCWCWDDPNSPHSWQMLLPLPQSHISQPWEGIFHLKVGHTLRMIFHLPSLFVGTKWSLAAIFVQVAADEESVLVLSVNWTKVIWRYQPKEKPWEDDEFPSRLRN